MSLDFRESYPVIQWDLNRRILQKHYIGSVGDSGNGYKVMILQDGDILTPTTEEVYFYFEKHDKTHGYIKAEIIDNMFIVDLTNQVFAVAGNVSCNFQIKSGTRWKTSPEFIIKVDKNNIQDSIESSDDFIAFQEAINNLATITDSVNTAISNTNTATQNAITATENAIEATNLANDTVDTINNETLIIYKPYVANYDAIATTYPTPELGWTTQANDSGTRWRWNGTEWTNIGVFSNDKVGDVTQLYTTAKQSIVASINEVGTQLAQIENYAEANYAKKTEVTNVLTPKGNIAYASLPSTGNEVGWYYYCPDGDGTNGPGNYVWNGTEWYFGGTGDQGYNKLKNDLICSNISFKPQFNNIGFIDKKGELSSNAAFVTTDYIPISGDAIYLTGKFRDLNTDLYHINCYNIDKYFLGGLIPGSKNVTFEFELEKINVLKEACYIRITSINTWHSTISLVLSQMTKKDFVRTEIFNDFVFNVNDLIEEAIKNLENNNIYTSGFSNFSKFCSIGDSLSVGYYTDSDGVQHSVDYDRSWGAYVEKMTGAKAYWSGKAGATCKSWLETTANDWGLNYCKTLGKFPLYVICMGANESNIPIGTSADIGTNNQTLYGYVSKVITELRNISPKSYIVCTGVSRQHIETSINNVYKDVCEHYDKCYYLDCSTEFNTAPFTTYYFNYHYSANGYCMMAKLFDEKLKNVIANNIEDFRWINEAEAET